MDGHRESCQSHKEALTLMQRKLSHSELRNMCETLKTTGWDHVFVFDNVSECYDSFIAHCINVLEIRVSVRKINPYKAII